MAWTERYVRSDAAGGGNGTTNTNSGANGAWTFAEGITNEVAGMRLNMKAGTYASTTTTRTFAAAGTATAPIWWRGFKTAAGDQDTNNVAVAGTDIPAITFTAGEFVVSGDHHIFSSLDISGAYVASTSGQVSASAANVLYYACRIENTAANGNARAIGGPSSPTLVRCRVTATTSPDYLCVLNAAMSAIGCVFVGGTNGLFLPSTCLFFGNVVRGQAGDGVQINSGGFLVNNSFYAQTGNGIAIGTVGNTIIANNYFENINQAGKAAINNTSGTNSDLIRCIANAFYNCTTNTSGITESFAVFDNGTLAGAAFTAPGSQDFSIGTVARALGFPGLFEGTGTYQGYLDVGAVQRQEPVGGGSTYIFQVES